MILLVSCAACQVCDGLSIVYTHALRGAGDNYWPALFGTLCAWPLLIGGGSGG